MLLCYTISYETSIISSVFYIIRIVQYIVKGLKGAFSMNINEAIASNLKRLRDARGLSLEQTAQMTGVSKSMLGQIERGAVNPTISVVWKIAVGLKVSFSSLIEDRAQAATLVRTSGVEPMLMDDGRYRNYTIFPFDEQAGFELFYLELLPGARLDAEAHLAGCEEYLLLHNGALEVAVGDAVYALRGNDALRFRADEPHSYRNVGADTLGMNMLIRYARDEHSL